MNEAAFNIFIIGPWYKLIKQLQYFNWSIVIFIKFCFLFILFKINQIHVWFPLKIVNTFEQMITLHLVFVLARHSRYNNISVW